MDDALKRRYIEALREMQRSPLNSIEVEVASLRDFLLKSEGSVLRLFVAQPGRCYAHDRILVRRSYIKIPSPQTLRKNGAPFSRGGTLSTGMQMDPAEVARQLANVLEAAHIPYAIGGALAYAYWEGEPHAAIP